MTTTYARERTLQNEIANAVERGLPGVEVLAVELPSSSRLSVFVDHPKGVDHALCGRVTELLDTYLDDYSIEVSSPGPERPLRKPSHFAAVLGRRVRVRTASEFEGRTKFKGEVLDAGDDAVTLAAAGRPEPVRIPYEAIARANLIDEGLTP